MLRSFYFHDQRMDLVAAETLAVDGVLPEMAEDLASRPGWSRAHVELLEAGIELFVHRYEALAERATYLSPPRLRNIGVVRDPQGVRPYSQILNESTCALYLDDLAPETSDPELVAFVLAMGERSAETGEILRSAVHLAPWWFERTKEECARFQSAAQRSPRPDADLYRAIADAVPWLRELGHRVLRPRRSAGKHREIPGTGLLVPRAHESAPDRLIGEIQAAATRTLQTFHREHRGPAPSETDALVDWLGASSPEVLVVDQNQEVLWDPRVPEACDALVRRLEHCGAATVDHVRGDLACVHERSRLFLDSLRDRSALAPPDPDTAQDGYTFLHRDRAMIAYNVDEPGIERLLGPGIPFARTMLGARTLHEWAHAAVDSGWVPRTVGESAWDELRSDLAQALEKIVAGLPPTVRKSVAPDLRELARQGPATLALVGVLEHRLPDFQANILAARYQTLAEREAYVRQNIRPLRREYDEAQKLRRLVRYAYEYQYLRFSEVEDPESYFFEMTWFETDFFETGVVSESQFADLLQTAQALCDAHAIDEGRFAELPRAQP